MLLDLTQVIKQQGNSQSFRLEGALPQELLVDGLTLTGPVVVEGTMCATGHAVAVNAHVQAHAVMPCALCLQDVSCDLDCPCDMLLQRKGYESETADDTDDDVLSFEGSSCDITPSVAQALNLGAPMRVVCKDSCKGLCPICGANLNEKTCGCAPDIDSPFSALAAWLVKDEE